MEVMTFGRHKGDPASDVPLRYLLWAMGSMESPPACVTDELRRRAGRHGTRDSIPAQAALSGFLATGKARRPKRPAKKAAGGEVVGVRYAETRRQWLASGGNPKSCPWEPPEWPG